jgi:hypothetical protein
MDATNTNTDSEYDSFIGTLKSKAPAGPAVQKHHIVPLHAGGLKIGETVLCPIEDHAKAHEIRYAVYGAKADKIAAAFIRGQTAEAIKHRSELIVETNKRRNNGFFIRGKKKRRWGWECIYKAISSEAGEDKGSPERSETSR